MSARIKTCGRCDARFNATLYASDGAGRPPTHDEGLSLSLTLWHNVRTRVEGWACMACVCGSPYRDSI